MAEKLKGLLDSARAKLTGLLGDAPKEFAVGAVSGVPGIVGDIGYTLANGLMTYTPGGRFAQYVGGEMGLPMQMPAMEDVPGTSDYLAAKAGYAPPESVSGQIGRVLGGIASPGPGDLGKIAPVLSAIPFWHGSPHKFDRFDLAHMGQGEGAQAYGWGAYGAESPEVAKQYLNVDPSVPVPPRRQFMGQDLEPGTPEYHAARLASEGKESLAGLRKLVAGWISEARPGEPTDGYQKTLEILNQAQKKSDFKQLKPEPNLYRGEYRWPDPAKEAATPLTGEDLLQWDRPLSEQSDSVKAFARKIYGDALPEKNSYGELIKGKDLYEYAQQRLASVGFRKELDSLGLNSLPGGMQEAASRYMSANGVPGIGYLDGASRNMGDGTHNIVMFDDKGIKLLERNGSPIEDFTARRAGKAKPYREAMGID